MTRDEVLAAGLAFVEEANVGVPRHRQPNTGDRVALALQVAAFLLAEAEAAEVPEATASDYEPAGPGRTLTCDTDPEDKLFVRSATPTTGVAGRPIVGFEATSASGAVVQLLASPAKARAFAAGILDAADEADGTTPLNFVSGGSA